MRSATLIILLLTALATNGQSFKKLEVSTDTTYGYTSLNPLLLRKGSPQNSIANTYKLIYGLRNAKGKSFLIAHRGSVTNSNYSRNGTYEVILDEYKLVTQDATDSVTLYIDIYNKGKLMVPHGLKWVPVKREDDIYR